MLRMLPATCAGLLILTTGCTANRTAAGWPDQAPLGAEYETYRPPPTPSGFQSDPNAVEDPTGALTLPQVLAMALQHNPELAVFAWEVRALDAAAVQAGIPENPEFEAELEEFGGTGDARGLAASVGTLSIGQTFKGPGTLLLSGRAARLERDLAGWDYEAARLDLVTEVRQRFVDVLAGQERLDAARQLSALAEQTREAIAGQVEAGKVSPVELTRADVELALVRLEQERSARELLAARQRLAELWGGQTALFDRVEDDLTAVVEPPSILALVSLVETNPDVARWTVEQERREAEVRLARAEGVPELTLRGGVQRFNETGDAAAIVGISLPLPVFDVNQGGVREARARRAQAQQQQRAALARTQTDLEGAYQELSAAYTEVRTLEQIALPGARAAFDSTHEAYREGKVALIDVLDAQRTASEVTLHAIDALASYRHALADIERLLGQPLPPASDDGPEQENGEER